MTSQGAAGDACEDGLDEMGGHPKRAGRGRIGLSLQPAVAACCKQEAGQPPQQLLLLAMI